MDDIKTQHSDTLVNLHRLTDLLTHKLGDRTVNPSLIRPPTLPPKRGDHHARGNVLQSLSSLSSSPCSSSSSSDEYIIIEQPPSSRTLNDDGIQIEPNIPGVDTNGGDVLPFPVNEEPNQGREEPNTFDSEPIPQLPPRNKKTTNGTNNNIAPFSLPLPSTYISYSPEFTGNDENTNNDNNDEDVDDTVDKDDSLIEEENEMEADGDHQILPLLSHDSRNIRIFITPPVVKTDLAAVTSRIPQRADDTIDNNIGDTIRGSEPYNQGSDMLPLIQESPAPTSPSFFISSDSQSLPSSSPPPPLPPPPQENTTGQKRRQKQPNLFFTALSDTLLVQSQEEFRRSRIETIPEEDQAPASNQIALLAKSADHIPSKRSNSLGVNPNVDTMIGGFRRRASSVLDGVKHKMHFDHRKKRRGSSPATATSFVVESFDGDFCRLKPIPGESGSEEEKSIESGETPSAGTKRNSKPSYLRESLFLILSSLYGILVVLMGAVIPITEIFIADDVDRNFEAFYVYLYSVSLVFLIYVYGYLLRRNRFRGEFMIISASWVRQLTRVLSRSDSNEPATNSSNNNNNQDARQRMTKKTISLDMTNHHTGTFFLRLGVLGFGIGSMIHCGLLFGSFFSLSGQCSQTIQIIKPLLHMVFVFFQLYFIFMNSKMCIHRYKKLARFGLMHMCATNVCVWFRAIVVETIHVISTHDHKSLHLATQNGDNESVATHEEVSYFKQDKDTKGDYNTIVHDTNTSITCGWSKMMKKAVDRAGPYLYPCTIEYSLMCACILYIMWKNVGQGPRGRLASLEEGEGEGDDEKSRIHRMSVDCTSSSRGLFLGILIMVATIISIIAFYMLVKEPRLKHSAFVLTHVSETTVYLLTLMALVLACVKMKSLTFKYTQETELEDILILISYTGLMAFIVFSLMASILHEVSTSCLLNILTNVTMLVQATLQTIFMLAGDRMSAANHEQVRKKPGREFVTFLLISNFAMWAINTFETQTPEHNPIQVDVYGIEAWAIFTHISVPLGIYYRFHSTVCMSNIWKNAWKMKKRGLTN